MYQKESSIKNETATSSKAAMDELLGKDGTTGTVGTQLAEITKALTGTDGIKKLVGDAITAAGNAQAPNQANLDIKAKFDILKGAVEKANTAIEEKLDSGDLTQLDTSNLKALKSSINDIESQLKTAFEDLSLKFNDNNANVPLDKLKKLQESLESGVFKSNTELGEKAGGVATSSQKQAETIAEMRGQLQAFAANPKGSELESANFTGYLETVDAALSNISDQRAKLGASQNERATSSKAAMGKFRIILRVLYEILNNTNRIKIKEIHQIYINNTISIFTKSEYVKFD